MPTTWTTVDHQLDITAAAAVAVAAGAEVVAAACMAVAAGTEDVAAAAAIASAAEGLAAVTATASVLALTIPGRGLGAVGLLGSADADLGGDAGGGERGGRSGVHSLDGRSGVHRRLDTGEAQVLVLKLLDNSKSMLWAW